MNLFKSWYNVVYQAAVFVSRSSIRLVKIKFLYIFPIFQVLNVAIALSEVFLGYFPGIWLAFILIFWEGLLGGGCYVK
jgi:battenin